MLATGREPEATVLSPTGSVLTCELLDYGSWGGSLIAGVAEGLGQWSFTKGHKTVQAY